jgi:hypothetical protein
MAIISAEISYPIGAFGKRKCEEISTQTGVVFDKFNPANRRNGFQTIRFSGPNDDAISKALDLLDGAITKFNRHKAWEKKNRIEQGINDTQKRKEQRDARRSQFADLAVDEVSGPPVPTREPEAQTTPRSQRRRIDVSGMMPGLIESRKKSVWEEKAAQRKKYTEEQHQPVVADTTTTTTTELTYEQMVAGHKILDLDEPPISAQIAWHEAEMGRPMLEPSTGPIPVDEDYQAAFREWQEKFIAKNSAPTEDELLDEAAEMFEQHFNPEYDFSKISQEEIDEEYELWESEHSVALNVLDEAIAEREFLLYRYTSLSPDHFICLDGDLCSLECAIIDPAYLAPCPV